MGREEGLGIESPAPSDREGMLPSVFQGATAYCDCPRLLEQAQAVFHEAALYKEIGKLARRWYKRNQRKPRVLDLCSATGLCALHTTRVVPVEKLTLVDNNPLLLSKSCSQLASIDKVALELCDAIYFKGESRYDLILMNSSYHHIEDDRKVAFLQNAIENLADGGQILIGEHFLPYYNMGDRLAFRNATVAFYKVLVDDLIARGVPQEVVGAFRMSGYSCWNGSYEYKVCMKIFKSHLRQAGLVINDSLKVWPEREQLERDAGSFAMALSSTLAGQTSL